MVYRLNQNESHPSGSEFRHEHYAIKAYASLENFSMTIVSYKHYFFGLNASGRGPLGKIMLRCQISDPKTKVTCYVMDTNTSYNLLLGRSRIHTNRAIPYTIHQHMTYCNEYGEV